MTKLSRPILLAVAVILAACGFAQRDASAKDPLPRTSLNLAFPDQHPYLVMTSQDVDRARRLADREPWARQAIDGHLRNVEQWIGQKWDKLPEKGDQEHWKVSARLFDTGIAYALSGERRFAEWVRDGLMAYAAAYPGLEMTRGRCKVFSQSSLYEAIWLVPLVQAYDLVLPSDAFTAGQREQVERDLLRPAVACFKIDDLQRDPRISDLHYRCYNFQAWHLSAVGLVGLALKDRQLVDYAVNSPYGLQHLIAHDVRDDGLFWERSVGYHRFVLSALLPFLEAAVHCGVDLYHLEIPGDGRTSEGCHYPTDTSQGPKSLRMMFQAPFYLAFPDMSTIALGDSDRGPLEPDWTTLLAWNRYGDPHLAWILRRRMGTAARAGFLHYYRYQYRYDGVRLNGKLVMWGRQDATYQLQGESVLATDEGVSQPDRYLLNDADLGDFVLEWTMTRLKDLGSQERAWVVYQTNPRNPGDRRWFGLMGQLPEVGRSYRFRMELTGEQVHLTRDGTPIPVQPQVSYALSDWRHLIYGLPSLDVAQAAADRAATWKDRQVGNTGAFQNGCTLLPSSGVAVLRQSTGDFTAAPRATAVALSYGPYGGGHGHPDKLNLVVYAQGRQWTPDYGSMPYETHWKTQWTSHTVSHNTLVVDGISQRPAGEKDHMWPVDSSEDRVLGKLRQFDPVAKCVSADSTSAYPGLRIEREVRLWRHCVVDRFEALPDGGSSKPALASERQFDYVLHVDGKLDSCSAELAVRPGPLGNLCGYQHIERPRSAAIGKPANIAFTAGGDRLRLWILPQRPPVELIVAEGLTNSPDERKPMVIVRKKGTQARFLTVFEPVDVPELKEEAIVEEFDHR